MRSRRRQAAGKHQGSTGGIMSQNEPTSIAALTAEAQQTLVHAQRQFELAADRVINRLTTRDVEEFRGRTQPLPEFSCTGIGVAGRRRGKAFNGLQYRPQGSVKLQLLALAYGLVR